MSKNAKSRYSHQIAKAHELIQKLETGLRAYDDLHGDAPNFADVGTIAQMTETLQEMVDQLYFEGECEPVPGDRGFEKDEAQKNAFADAVTRVAVEKDGLTVHRANRKIVIR